MRWSKWVHNSIPALLLSLVLIILGGCGSETAQVTAEAPADAEQTESTSVENGEESVIRGEEVITVHSTEELLEAIRPGAEIVMEAGYYDLSEFAETAMAEGREFWEAGEEYVRLQECFDGTEIVISGVDDLIIRGGTDLAADTELVIEPRYATVLTFEDCHDLHLYGLTMGHTDQGACEGSVLRFSSCRDIELDRMDLYGCGVYGIEALNGTGSLHVLESKIRDCDYGPFSIEDPVGPIEFMECALYGSNGAGFYAGSDDSTLRFSRCSFGEAESNVWYFREDITAEDCTWSEITQYPDYSGMEEIDGETGL